MPSIVRAGDTCTGHDCHPPRPNLGGSPTVFVNGIGIHRLSDGWGVHCCGNSCHASVLAAASASLYVNGQPAARVGDPIACGGVAATGSPSVFAG